MAKINTQNTINAILAENVNLTVKDVKTIFIKDGGMCIYPVIGEDGKAHLAHKSFTHEHVLAARAEKKALKAEAKAQKDAEKAQAKAQAALAKAQARVAEAQAKADAAQAAVAGDTQSETVTVIA